MLRKRRAGLPTKTGGIKEDFLEEWTPEWVFFSQMKREEGVFQEDRMFTGVYVQK